MNHQHNLIERFYSLDALRGLAALSVVFWHWQHFFFSGTKLGTFNVKGFPFFEEVFVFYSKGWLAVDLFFSLSGFVFYWLYSKRIANGAISPSRFFLLRFSRLYPLHLATLLFVAFSQWWLFNKSGSYFVYPNNDGYHFLLNLGFASSWGFECGYSFNGPIWSVSVEVLLYALFFLCSRLIPVRAIILAIISIFGFFVVQKYYHPIGRGIGSFFLGGCAFLAYQAIVNSRHAATITRWAAIIMVSSWAGAIVIAQQGGSLTLRGIPVLWHLEAYFQWIVWNSLWQVLLLFPLTILSLALIETRIGPLGKRISFLGDISYSSYLIHFPLQLLFSAVLAQFSFSDSIYYSSWLMMLFMTILITISFISFRYFEMPAQRYLRQIGLGSLQAVVPEERAMKRSLP